MLIQIQISSIKPDAWSASNATLPHYTSLILDLNPPPPSFKWSQTEYLALLLWMCASTQCSTNVQILGNVLMNVCGPLQCSSNIDLTMQWRTSASLHTQCSSIDCRYLAMNRTVSKPSVNGADIEANCRPCVIKGEMSEIMLLFHFANNDTILQPAMLDGHWVCNQSWDFP